MSKSQTETKKANDVEIIMGGPEDKWYCKFVHTTIKGLSVTVFKNNGNGNSYISQKSFKDKDGNWQNQNQTLFASSVKGMIELLTAVDKHFDIQLVPVTQYITTERGDSDSPAFKNSKMKKAKPSDGERKITISKTTSALPFYQTIP